MFDWSVAIGCDEVSCGTVSLTHQIRLPTAYGLGPIVLCLVLLMSSGASAIYEFVKFVETCSSQVEIEEMLHGIVDTGFSSPFHRIAHVWRCVRAQSEGHRELPEGELHYIGNMAWADFLNKVCSRIQRDRSFGIVEYKEFDCLRAVQALMVYDNYFIALNQYGVFESGALKYVDDNVIVMLISSLFDEFNTLVRDVDPSSILRWRVLRYLGLYVIFYPFVVVHFILRVLVKNAAMIRTDWGGYMKWDWNRRAVGTFSLYNEVPHVSSARLASGRAIAMEMIDRLKPYSSGKRFVCRAASGVILVLFGLSLVNTSLLVSGSLCGIPLLWWLTVFLAAFSVCNEALPVEREYNYLPDHERLVEQLHHNQEEWARSGESFYNAITWDFLESRLAIIVGDIARTLFMPCILLGLLCDGSLRALADRVYSESVRVNGLGSVAREAAFDYHCVDKDCATLSELSDKFRLSVASFSAIYSEWVLKRVHGAASMVDSPKGEVSLNRLDALLVELNDGVDAMARNNLMDGPAVGTLCAPDSHTGMVRNSAYFERGTAHDREQLFVSHVMHSFYGSSSFVGLGRQPPAAKPLRERREGP